jgi:hypothetical protein
MNYLGFACKFIYLKLLYIYTLMKNEIKLKKTRAL